MGRETRGTDSADVLRIPGLLLSPPPTCVSGSRKLEVEFLKE